MADWKAIIVGDAFRLPSRDINYYRDLFLMCPSILLWGAATIQLLITPGHDHHVLGLKYALLATCVVFLGRAKQSLFALGMGFSALSSLHALIFAHEWQGFFAFLITGIPFWLIYRTWPHVPPYERRSGMTMVELALGVVSLGATVAVFQWLRPPHP